MYRVMAMVCCRALWKHFHYFLLLCRWTMLLISSKLFLGMHFNLMTWQMMTHFEQCKWLQRSRCPVHLYKWGTSNAVDSLTISAIKVKHVCGPTLFFACMHVRTCMHACAFLCSRVIVTFSVLLIGVVLSQDFAILFTMISDVMSVHVVSLLQPPCFSVFILALSTQNVQWANKYWDGYCSQC